MVKERVAASSDSEEEVATKPTKRQNIAAEDASKEEEDRMDEDELGEDEDDGDEEEYEIEAILDARRGAFGEGKIGYLVKWKNYGEEHNSWVNEDDAQNAASLISEYWRKHGKKGKQTSQTRKSTDGKARKSVSERDEASDDEDKRPKKRGRVSKSQEAVEEDEQPQTKKRGRKSTNGVKARKSPEPEPMSEDHDLEPQWVDVKSVWKSKQSWEPYIESIDTVERTEDGRLFIYFTIKNGKGRAREESSVCRSKMSNMLLDFYERNLRWREVNGNE